MAALPPQADAPPLPPLAPLASAPSSPGRSPPPANAAALLKLAGDCAAAVGAPHAAAARKRAHACRLHFAYADVIALFFRAVSACRGADELEALTRGARSHREKCAVLLGAALNAKLALEQAAEGAAASLDGAEQMQLRRVCASLLSALRLGATRVKLYGRRVVCACGWLPRVAREGRARARAHAARSLCF
jgi:hypothetical protein